MRGGDGGGGADVDDAAAADAAAADDAAADDAAAAEDNADAASSNERVFDCDTIVAVVTAADDNASVAHEDTVAAADVEASATKSFPSLKPQGPRPQAMSRDLPDTGACAGLLWSDGTAGEPPLP